MNFVVMNFVVTNFVVTNFVVKKIFEQGAAHGKFHAPILLFLKGSYFLSGLDHNGNMQIKRRQLNPEESTVPDQQLLIYTTSYPPSFSVNTSFKRDTLECQPMKKKRRILQNLLLNKHI